LEILTDLKKDETQVETMGIQMDHLKETKYLGMKEVELVDLMALF
jgi:hypothetical protein